MPCSTATGAGTITPAVLSPRRRAPHQLTAPRASCRQLPQQQRAPAESSITSHPAFGHTLCTLPPISPISTVPAVALKLPPMQPSLVAFSSPSPPLADGQYFELTHLQLKLHVPQWVSPREKLVYSSLPFWDRQLAGPAPTPPHMLRGPSERYTRFSQELVSRGGHLAQHPRVVHFLQRHLQASTGRQVKGQPVRTTDR